MKNLVFVFALLVSTLALAGTEQVKVMFSTKGLDTYADGTAVLKGERYALVWKAAQDGVVTISADGSVSGGKMVLCFETKEAGRCSDVLFTVSQDYLASQGISGGFWSVYLLDTRVWNNGVVSLAARNGNGFPKLINGAEASADAVSSDTSLAPGALCALAGIVTQPTDISNAPKPVIKSLELKGDFVELTVENVVDYINYGVSSGSTPDALKPVPSVMPQNGAAGTITVIVPKTGAGAGFFQVNRK